MLYNDINLIPRRKSKWTPTRVLIVVLAVFTAGSYFGNFLVYEPLKERNEKRERLETLNKQIESYGDIATDYVNAKNIYNDYNARTEALRGIINNDFPATSKIETIVFSTPIGMEITSFSIADNYITVTVNALSYDMIGDYIETLNKVEQFESVSYNTIRHSILRKIISVKTEDTPEEVELIDIYNVTLSIKVKD
ncbi:MAG: hypothetical protein K6F63_06855 [Lachnospiraceae bacterium]|nr:hypothetical protein [Lachnospiraceae bacterium]